MCLLPSLLHHFSLYHVFLCWDPKFNKLVIDFHCIGLVIFYFRKTRLTSAKFLANGDTLKSLNRKSLIRRFWEVQGCTIVDNPLLLRSEDFGRCKDVQLSINRYCADIYLTLYQQVVFQKLELQESPLLPTKVVVWPDTSHRRGRESNPQNIIWRPVKSQRFTTEPSRQPSEKTHITYI